MNESKQTNLRDEFAWSPITRAVERIIATSCWRDIYAWPFEDLM